MTLSREDISVLTAVTSALDYFAACQLPDGAIPDASIARYPTANLLKYWDTVNALKAIAIWRNAATGRAGKSGAAHWDNAIVDRVLAFLRGCEKPNGMISWGTLEVGPSEFCTETSSEYISALTHLGLREQATRKALYLRSRQLPSGAWSEVHPHVPKAFQTTSSVTGFAMMALVELGLEPTYVDEALDFLAKKQTRAGHFGINWFYYNTYYYLTRPATAALAAYGCHSAVAAVCEFTLANQRDDGSWFVEVEGFDDAPSEELQSALALQTLACAGLGLEEPAVRKGLDWLMGRQRADGSWSGGPFPYPNTETYRDFRALQDVYSTSQVLILLDQLLGK